MDRTETYIKMSWKAQEIQSLRREEKHHNTGKWLDGDFYGSVLDNLVFVVHRSNDAWADEPYYIHHPSEAIWLPRQDQLQEMLIPEHYESFVCLVSFFSDWIGWQRHTGYQQKFCSIEWINGRPAEQLWLAFVMKEKYNKTWDGETWSGELTNNQD